MWLQCLPFDFQKFAQVGGSVRKGFIGLYVLRKAVDGLAAEKTCTSHEPSQN
ncbi:hypothetical protein CGMCC3_g14166 [Colletotrichum fructicola]|nr:uncharacterized protein CGMCC3_g14166 [Colletotrichum fructicola]KAE9569757.1 hypothetical protein CGMCC3_g14166 [Colletotrichum fructicola]